MNNLAQKTIDFFNTLDSDHISSVDTFYATDAQFVDPIANLKGSQAIRKYYANLYQHVIDISFSFTRIVVQGNNLSAQWDMTLTLKKLNRGQPYTVSGLSLIEFNTEGQAVFHQDYYDMGEFVYERLSILGPVIRYIKGRLHQH